MKASVYSLLLITHLYFKWISFIMLEVYRAISSNALVIFVQKQAIRYHPAEIYALHEIFFVTLFKQNWVSKQFSIFINFCYKILNTKEDYIVVLHRYIKNSKACIVFLAFSSSTWTFRDLQLKQKILKTISFFSTISVQYDLGELNKVHSNLLNQDLRSLWTYSVCMTALYKTNSEEAFS